MRFNVELFIINKEIKNFLSIISKLAKMTYAKMVVQWPNAFSLRAKGNRSPSH